MTLINAMVKATSEIDERRALYVYARRRGFPAVSLELAKLTVEQGEPAWRTFAQHSSQAALWEAALELDQVPEVA